MDSDYQYKGIPITPAIAEYIITSQLAGKQLRRAQIVDEVQKFHMVNGGLPEEAASLVMTIKKALQNLKRKAQARNPSTGWWQIEQPTGEAKPSSQASENAGEQQTQAGQDEQCFVIEIVDGTGEEGIYVYYFPAYKKAALANGSDRWLCKIGRTDVLPRIRISEQSTGMPEQPVIGLVFKTDESRILESVVHGILNLRGQWSETSPGVEWFVTSPADVLALIRQLVPGATAEKEEATQV